MSQPTKERGGLLRSLLSVAGGLVLAGLLMWVSGYSPTEAYGAIWTGATGIQSGPPAGPGDIAWHLKLGSLLITLGNWHINTFLLAQSLARVTPLLFCGLAVALGLRAGLFNIGVQGQMTVGALAAAYVGLFGAQTSGKSPLLPHILLVLLAGALAGAAWGALPGLLKAWRGVHEVLSTIMLNFVGINVVTYLVFHHLKDPNSQNTQSAQIAQNAWLPPLVAHSNLTIGLLLSVAAAFLLTFLIQRTALGYQIRAVGSSAEAAQAAGISVTRTIVLTMALSGALGGIAGAIEVMGVHHRYLNDIAGTYGFDGIAVALLGGLGGGAILTGLRLQRLASASIKERLREGGRFLFSILLFMGSLCGGGMLLSALFFGSLASGAYYMESLTRVPAPISIIVQAVVILFVGMRLLPRSAASPAPVAETPAEERRSIPDASL